MTFAWNRIFGIFFLNRILLRHDVFIFISIEKSESIDRLSFKLAHLSCSRVCFPKLSNSALNTASTESITCKCDTAAASDWCRTVQLSGGGGDVVELLAQHCWCRETLGSPTRPKLTDGSVVRLYRTKNQTAAGAGAASLFLIVFNRPPTNNPQKNCWTILNSSTKSCFLIIFMV